MKRTCNGCRALDVTRRGPCELGYAVRETGIWPHTRYAPGEECPKPRTIAECNRLTTEANESARRTMEAQ